MKVTYIERIERRTAFSRKMYCGQCGEHEYEIVEQLEPKAPEPFPSTLWFIQCANCGHATPTLLSRKSAIQWWKHEC